MADALLDIRDLDVTFRVPDMLGRSKRDVRAVRDVSLRVGAREVVGVVGESGSGKSTVARTIVGLVRPTSGTIRWKGTLLPTARGAAARAGVQMVFQDHASTLNPFQPIWKILDDVMRVARPEMTAPQRRGHAEELMQRIGLGGDALQRRASSFSGGQRQRISIARALSTAPKLLICDEPTSALDVSVQAQILALLASLRDDGLSLLFISHNLAVVRQIADRIAVMYAGLLVEEGPARDLIARPLHPYTLALVSAAPVLTDRGSLFEKTRRSRVAPAQQAVFPTPQGCPFVPRCPRADAACAVLPPLVALKPGRAARCHHPLEAALTAPFAISEP